MTSLAGGSCICWNELRVQLDSLMVSKTSLWPDNHLAGGLCLWIRATLVSQTSGLKPQSRCEIKGARIPEIWSYNQLGSKGRGEGKAL